MRRGTSVYARCDIARITRMQTHSPHISYCFLLALRALQGSPSSSSLWMWAVWTVGVKMIRHDLIRTEYCGACSLCTATTSVDEALRAQLSLGKPASTRSIRTSAHSLK